MIGCHRRVTKNIKDNLESRPTNITKLKKQLKNKNKNHKTL